jgi:glycosyltransferase involved in cell wall biosynthesis
VRAAVVLHVPNSPHSSVVISYAHLAARMRARGHSLEIVTPDMLWPGLDARLNPVGLPVAARRWLRTRADLDLVIFHSYVGWLAARPHPSLRIVTAFHGFEPLFHQALEAETARRGGRLSRRYATMYGRLMPRMLRRACRRSDLVLCLNAQERDALVAGGYATPDRVKVVWHDAPDGFLQAHGYRPRAETLLSVMQWLPTKGTAYLVEAFSRAARARPELRLIVAGSLVSEADVARAFPEDVRDRIEVHPSFDEARERALLARADLFVHPSLSEGFSRAVIGALAAGVPVITTRTGFAVDRLADGVDAAIVPVADSTALADAIDRLAGDLSARRRLGEAGQAHARRLTDADGLGQLIDHLERLTAGPA